MPLSKIQTVDNQVIPNLGRRNLIINGAMQVAQRGTSQASINSAGYYVHDRFRINTNDAGVWTQIQETLTTSDTPFQNGFTKALKLDCTTASSSLAANGTLQIQQAFEGFDLQRLGSGSSGAKAVTVSFWIKATKTGTNILGSYQDDGGKQVAKTYTINASNTWEFKTVTLPGNTAHVVANDNTRGRLITWYFAAGSNRTTGTLRNTWTAYAVGDEAPGQVNHADDVANNIHITGIQVEVGDSASEFEHLPVGETLALCQRYLYRRRLKQYDVMALGHSIGGNLGRYLIHLPTAMRIRPSVSDGGDIACWYSNGGAITAQTGLANIYMPSDEKDFNQIYLTADASATINSNTYTLALTASNGSANADSFVQLDAEL